MCAEINQTGLRVGHWNNVGFGQQDIGNSIDDDVSSSTFDRTYVNHLAELLHHYAQIWGRELLTGI